MLLKEVQIKTNSRYKKYKESTQAECSDIPRLERTHPLYGFL